MRVSDKGSVVEGAVVVGGQIRIQLDDENVNIGMRITSTNGVEAHGTVHSINATCCQDWMNASLKILDGNLSGVWDIQNQTVTVTY